MAKPKKTKEQFILDSKKVWGDNTYDYSKLDYQGYQKKCIFICIKHNVEFQQTPAQHLHGACGCKQCQKEKLSKSLEQFLEDARKVHGNKYDYSKVEYKGHKEKVCIICPKHGEFWQLPTPHTQGEGCPHCERERRSKTTEQFIKEAREVHGNRYDYSKVKYINRNTLVTIICSEHGEFKQAPFNHLKGKGCPKCAKNYQYGTKEFIEKANKIHNNKYDYSKVQYQTAKIPVTIICPEHGEFEQTPDIHLRGCGCKKCQLKSQTKLYEKLKESFPNEEILFEVDNTIVPWLKSQRFDIYFPKYNIAIEYNGQQHYIPVDIFGGKLSLNNTKERDKLKRQKCKENNCTLFEIKYDYTENDYNNLKNNIYDIINT